MNVLVTGGAGYIGSHLIGVLASAGHNCTVYDNLAGGHAEAVGDTNLITGDISDASTLTAAMRENDIEAVIHLAAFIEAGESVEKPEKYFRNNTLGGLALLEADDRRQSAAWTPAPTPTVRRTSPWLSGRRSHPADTRRRW